MTRPSSAWIIAEGAAVLARARQFKENARRYFYRVVLSGHHCPRCGDALAMQAEGRCSCRTCGWSFDPTLEFQKCPACDARPRLRVRRYVCSWCGTDVTSRYLFDGLVFDAAYFRAKMAESRARREAVRAEFHEQAMANRSAEVAVDPVESGGLASLLAALNDLTAGVEAAAKLQAKTGFDLRRYEHHVEAHISTTPMSLDEIPPLEANTRLDRVGRFVAVIFLAHAHVVDVWQAQSTIWVSRHEADAEG